MNGNAIWIDASAAGQYHFCDDHPFHPVRLKLTEQLLKRINALDPSRIFPIFDLDATDHIVRSLHRPDYVAAVQSLSLPSPAPEAVRQAEAYGLAADGDTPYFPNMHETSLAIAAGSLAAAEAVMSGKCTRALHLGGGLHHAFPGKASGFCIYNDAAAAIAHIRNRYGAKVLYVDTDVHHGDGVQWFFYTDPDVFTLSIHETGKYLFPGTGFANERGESAGYGTCLNLPMEPYTEDESWLSCFSQALEAAVASFKPDVIVSQHGCDAHAFDPLAHLHCSMKIYREMPRLIREQADQHTGGRWVALGGGGYDHWRVVPRAWGLLWLEMSGHPLLEAIDATPGGTPLPDNWLGPYSSGCPHAQMPTSWLDDTSAWPPMPRRTEITETNKRMLEIALQHL